MLQLSNAKKGFHFSGTGLECRASLLCLEKVCRDRRAFTEALGASSMACSNWGYADLPCLTSL